MSIVVLGIDLGKNVCSLVGLHDAGAVILLRATACFHCNHASWQVADEVRNAVTKKAPARTTCDAMCRSAPSKRHVAAPPASRRQI